MSTLTNILHEIASWLYENFPDALQDLKPMITKSYAKSLLSEFSLLPNNEICDLYAWRNGLYAESPYYNLLFQGYNFNSLQDTLVRYEGLMLVQEETANNPNFGLFWDRQWLPIFSKDRSHIITICTSNDFSLYQRDVTSHKLRCKYNNLTSMARTTLECLTNGVYTIDDEFINVDREAAEMIRQKYNPETSPFPFD
jgi:hypothetical protein